MYLAGFGVTFCFTVLPNSSIVSLLPAARNQCFKSENIIAKDSKSPSKFNILAQYSLSTLKTNQSIKQNLIMSA
jgi:hypothetical protein